jgi:integrase
VEVSPKSAQSKRTIELDNETVKVLRHHRSRQAEEQLAAGEAWHETGLVFAWQDGSGPSPYWVSHRFTQLASDAGLPAITLHGLRHSHATALLSAGIHPKIAQERLGHHSAAFTLDVYSSVLPTMQREAIQRLSESAG